MDNVGRKSSTSSPSAAAATASSGVTLGGLSVVAEDALDGAPKAPEAGGGREGLEDLVGEQQQNLDSCHLEGASPKGIMDVRVKPEIVNFRRQDSLNISATGSYEMSAKPRGLALIIANEKYDQGDERIGSEVDRRNLKSLLEGLHFEVRVELDLRYDQLRDLLARFAEDPGHEGADMMVLAILSHGKDGRITDGSRKDYPVEKVYEQFNNQRCPQLKGKPKWFIIQACRGDDKDYAAVHDKRAPRSVSASPQSNRRTVEADSIPFSSGRNDIDKARPTWEDMIISYSTIPGYASMRDHEHGSWFVQSLVEVFMNHAHEFELIDLLRTTSERLSQFTNEWKEKQTCNVEMRHLYKRIYFHPGQFREAAERRRLSRSLVRSLSTPPPSPRKEPEPSSAE